MAYIKFGSLWVPILPLTYTYTTDVAQQANFSTAYTDSDLWNAGIQCAEGETNAGEQTAITEATMSGGRTGLHSGDAELIVGTPYREPDRDNALWYVNWVIEQNSTEYASAYAQISDMFSNSSPTRVGTWKIVAQRFQFPNASHDNEKRYGYKFLVTGRIEYASGQLPYTYVVHTFYLQIPYLNRIHETDMYFVEEDEPPGPEPEDPNDEGEPADEGGGDGDHTPIYDPIPIPNAPTLGAANAGFLTMYKLGLAAINTFASDMFASSVWEAIRLFFSNPIDFLVGCMLLPFEPATGSSYHPKFGIVAFEHAYPAVSNQYKDIDCGSINITKYWGSCFDYEPYTKIQIWLPYIGYRELPVDEIMDMTVSVKYRCDCLTGDCVAFVYTGVVGQTGPQVERVIGQFYGNCGVRVPFGSVSYDSAVSASISLIGAAATTGLSAGAGAMSQTGGAIGGLMAGADAVMTDGNVRSASIGVVQGLKPNVHKGGAAGASTGYMSIQKPYIIRRIPRQNLPSNFMHLKGYPSNIGGTLGDFTGLAVVDDIQLNNIPAMEDERKEIITWLRGGVLI